MKRNRFGEVPKPRKIGKKNGRDILEREFNLRFRAQKGMGEKVLKPTCSHCDIQAILVIIFINIVIKAVYIINCSFFNEYSLIFF